MFNKKQNNGAFWATVIGTSIGIIISTRTTNLNSKKMMKTAKRVKNNFKDGVNNLWS